MESDSTLAWLVLVISLASFSLVTLVDTSLASVRRERVQWLVAQSVRRAAALDGLSSSPLGPSGALSPVRYLLLASSLLSGMALSIASWGTGWWPASLVGLSIVVFLGAINITAKALASFVGERIALRAGPLVSGFSTILKPVFAIERKIIRRSLRRDADPSNGPIDALPPELPLSVGPDGQPLDEREVRMIRGVLHLDKTTAREIMVPRVDMVAAEMGILLSELAELMTQSGHSRVPIFEGDLDHIKGIAYAMDILSYVGRDQESSAVLTPKNVRPAQFIPEAKTLEELLNDIQERRIHMAIVVDEYGGVSGLVTIEDLLEEIVGEIQDEFDVGEPEIEPVSEREFLMDARTSIDQLGELLNISVESDGFDTVGGFVYQRLGKIPSSGDTVEYDGLKIEVVSTVGRRLKKLRVIRSAEGGREP